MKMPRHRKATRMQRVTTDYGDVALDQRTGKYWHLNESAARVLSMLEAGKDSHAAARDLAEHYDIPVEQAERDVQTIADNFKAQGLL